PLRGRVRDVRGLGAIQAVELDADDPGYLAHAGPRLRAAALERGVLLRPLGNVLYAMPPFCLSDEEADRVGEVMAELSREI
ncbi:MAG: aminotransferase class III-fold pyridoxal phosphate-dependent enzyme, partial [Planctomycetota bacterium]